jgi:hypothetical protein
MPIKHTTIASILTKNYIHAYAFHRNNKLTYYIVKDNIKYIEDGAFSYCRNLEYFSYNNAKIKKIKKNTFENDFKLKTILLNNNIIEIESYAFSGCISLKEITIPMHVKHIHEYTFLNCKELTTVNIYNHDIKIDNNAFLNCKNVSLNYL